MGNNNHESTTVVGMDDFARVVSYLMERRKIGLRRRFSEWTVRDYPYRPPEPWRANEEAFLIPSQVVSMMVDSTYIQRCETHNRQRIDEIKVSIEVDGLLKPIELLYDPDGKIRLHNGNHRYIAMRELEWKHMPCTLSKVNKAIRGYGRHLSDHTETIVDLISKK